MYNISEGEIDIPRKFHDDLNQGTGIIGGGIRRCV
jgi:hypothetical protein